MKILNNEEIMAIIRENYGSDDEPHPIPVGKLVKAQHQQDLNDFIEILEGNKYLTAPDASSTILLTSWEYSVYQELIQSLKQLVED